MVRESAGILLYRRSGGRIEVLLAHPGGPLWRGRDAGAWMMPKGLIEPGEEPVAAAWREFAEELGVALPTRPWHLTRICEAGGKWVEALCPGGEVDPTAIVSLPFELEWPPRSARRQAFPEVDEARWFPLAEARGMILKGQRLILDALANRLAVP